MGSKTCFEKEAKRKVWNSLVYMELDYEYQKLMWQGFSKWASKWKTKDCSKKNMYSIFLIYKF